MTAPQERPAGRLACGARPAGAVSGRGTGAAIVDPLIIRAALAHSEGHAYLATATRFGVSVRTVTRWRERQAAAAAAGQVWPSDADVTAWAASRDSRAANRARQASWVRRRVLTGGPLLINSLGTARRLRALAAIGWRNRDIAAELGVTATRIGHLARREDLVIHRDTAAAVAAVYDRLSMKQGPSELNRARAARLEWPPPLAWDEEWIDDPRGRPNRAGGNGPIAFDEVAVQRAIHGDAVPLRPVERAEAVRRLTTAGRSAAEIAELLNTTPRSVARHRTRHTPDARRSA